MKKMVSGQLVDLTEAEEQKFREDAIRQRDEGYKEERRAGYPDWHLQLEALYDDIQAGAFGDNAKRGQFSQAVDAVKARIPKQRPIVVEDAENLDPITKEVYGL